jgi:hypothetical protein
VNCSWPYSNKHGPIIGIFHQYAHHGTGKTIHSVSQLRHFGTIVDNTPRCFNGKQRLETLDDYIIPLSIRSGLPYMDMSPPTTIEIDTYPHVLFTPDTELNPQRIVDEYPIHEMDLTNNDLQHNDYHPDTINVYGELILQHVHRIFITETGVKTKLMLINSHRILDLSQVFASNTR